MAAAAEHAPAASAVQHAPAASAAQQEPAAAAAAAAAEQAPTAAQDPTAVAAQQAPAVLSLLQVPAAAAAQQQSVVAAAQEPWRGPCLTPRKSRRWLFLRVTAAGWALQSAVPQPFVSRWGCGCVPPAGQAELVGSTHTWAREALASLESARQRAEEAEESLRKTLQACEAWRAERIQRAQRRAAAAAAAAEAALDRRASLAAGASRDPGRTLAGVWGCGHAGPLAAFVGLVAPFLLRQPAFDGNGRVHSLAAHASFPPSMPCSWCQAENGLNLGAGTAPTAPMQQGQADTHNSSRCATPVAVWRCCHCWLAGGLAGAKGRPALRRPAAVLKPLMPGRPWPCMFLYCSHLCRTSFPLLPFSLLLPPLRPPLYAPPVPARLLHNACPRVQGACSPC